MFSSDRHGRGFITYAIYHNMENQIKLTNVYINKTKKWLLTHSSPELKKSLYWVAMDSGKDETQAPTNRW